MTSTGWPEYQLLVLAKLEEHGKDIRKLITLHAENAVHHEEIRGELRHLKVKASIWGLLAGTLPSLVAVLLLILKG